MALLYTVTVARDKYAFRMATTQPICQTSETTHNVTHRLEQITLRQCHWWTMNTLNMHMPFYLMTNTTADPP